MDVIIPVYNQYEALTKTVRLFSMQKKDGFEFRIIVVDDGSSDELKDAEWNKKFKTYGMDGEIIHTPNLGRAAARNMGLKHSENEYIVFCDADRFPSPDFLHQHLDFQEKGNDIVVGVSFDYFGKKELIDSPNIDWDMIEKYSRVPVYLNKISSIYDQFGNTSSPLSWLSFLVGNSSVKRELLLELEGFDESFKEWGFEHFELGYRMYCAGKKFAFNKMAKNYHQPHSRSNNFYDIGIEKNSKLLSQKHTNIDSEVLYSFVKGRICKNEAEEFIFTYPPLQL